MQNKRTDRRFEALPIEIEVPDFDAASSCFLDLRHHAAMDEFGEPAAAEYEQAGERDHRGEEDQSGHNAQEDSSEFPHLKTSSLYRICVSLRVVPSQRSSAWVTR